LMVILPVLLPVFAPPPEQALTKASVTNRKAIFINAEYVMFSPS